jgi:hypothetical protein
MGLSEVHFFILCISVFGRFSKNWPQANSLDGVVSQKTVIFIVMTVGTLTLSDPMSDLVGHYDFPVPLLFLM